MGFKDGTANPSIHDAGVRRCSIRTGGIRTRMAAAVFSAGSRRPSASTWV